MSARRAEHVSLRGRLIQVIAWFVIAALVLLLAVSVVVPRIAGATPYTILTGSMQPGMPPGTLVVVRPVDFSDIGIGSVITYQLESGRRTVVTHRVVAVGTNLKGEPFVETRGDANDVADEKPVIPAQVRGERWYHLPYVGYAVNLFPQGERQVALVVVVIGLLGYAATMAVGSVRDRRAGVSR